MVRFGIKEFIPEKSAKGHKFWAVIL